MKILKWIKSLFSPESQEVVAEPFPELKKEKTAELVVKPSPPKKKTRKKPSKGKKNG